MAAYAAVISLKHTLNGLLKSSSVEILESANNDASSLQQVLEGLNGRSRSRSSRDRVDDLEGQIRDCAHRLEDVLEFHELKLEEDGYGDEGELRLQINSFGKTAKRMEKEFIQELSRDIDNNDDDDDDDDDAATGCSDIDFGVKMIGRVRLLDTVLNFHLRGRMRPDDTFLYAFRGEQGSGTRVVTKIIFEGAARTKKFDCGGWARVGANYSLEKVVVSIIDQVLQQVNQGDIDDIDVDYESLLTDDDVSEDYLSSCLYKLLENRRYMIVLDDVDEVDVVEYLKRTAFPDQSNGSVVLLTTNSEKVALFANVSYNYAFPNMYEADFWLSMRKALFGWESIPAELEVAGKKIVHNCRCRYISAAKTLLLLSKTDKTVEQWRKIAADKENPIFTVANEISEISKIKEEMQQCEREIIEQALYWVDFSFSWQAESVKMIMHPERFFSKMQIISFFGMVGIGKTTFARNIVKNDFVLNFFDHHVWIFLGPKYQTEEILIDILAQIYPNIHKLQMKGDEKLVRDLCAQVSGKRCLIVLDDLHSKEPLFHLKSLFPAIRGTILVTTRLPKVAKFEKDDTTIEMQLLNEEESWCLLREKVFDGGLCPPELEKDGRKIANKCDGLPLLILTVADKLRKVEQSEEYWNNIASGKEKSVFKSAHHEISEALLPSYHNLPQHLKPCFLYIGVFLERYEIPTSDLTNLWISERFLKPYLVQMEEDFAAQCLFELVDRCLVIVQRKVSESPITTCRLHSVFWHLSNNQVVKNKLFHAINSYDDCSIERIESQRRLSIRNNILLGMKDLHKSMASNTSAHSLLCIGPFHQYPVPINFDLRLLRVMSALMIRLYEFPIEVVRFVHLRYLSLTYNGELPTPISKLWKLQHLIVKRYMNIKSSKDSFYLPLEIWDMKELKHLQIMGGCLPNHRHGSGLLNLSTLLDVSAQSCGDEVLKWIPNLKRLGIRIELAPTDEGNSFRCFNNIHLLHKLESFKCVVVNPQIKSEVVAPPPALITMFPQNLKKLSLSGFGYPWEHMSIFGELENLEVLKLKCYAFQGPKWEMHRTNQFKKLKFLLLEDNNLVNWEYIVGSGMKVERICIKHCYKLQELPLALCMNDCLKKIEIVDCSPLLVTWAQKLGLLMEQLEVNIHRSWSGDTHRK